MMHGNRRQGDQLPAMALSVNILLLEPPALHVVDVADGHERVRIELLHDGFHLRFLEPRDDAENNLLAVPRVRAFAGQVGDSPPEPVDDRRADLRRGVADDPDRLGLVHPLDRDVDRLVRDEIGDQRVHRAVPLEDEAGGRQNEQVEEHDDFADRERRLLVDQDRDDLGAVHRTAEPDDEADSDAEDDASENRGENLRDRERRDRLEQERAE